MKSYLTYFGYFGWLFLLWYVAVKQRHLVMKQEHVNDKTVTRYNWFFTLLAIAPLVYLAVKRGNFGDTRSYQSTFRNSPSTFSAIPAYMETIHKDQTFYYLTAVLRCVIGDQAALYFGIIASVQVLLLSKTIRKYSPSLLIALFIFVASVDYISWMWNGIRQFLAASIIFGSFRWIFEKKYFRAILAVLFASLFHQSALLMLPVIFIVQGEPWNKSTVMVLLVSLVAVFFVNQFTSILDDLLADTQYTNVVSDFTNWGDNGTNPLRVMVYSVPAILSVIGLPYIREENDKVINVCVNMSVITAGLYLISMVTSGLFLGRLPIYTSMFGNFILLPWEIDHIFTKESSSFIRSMMIVMFMLFYIYQMHAWGIV